MINEKHLTQQERDSKADELRREAQAMFDHAAALEAELEAEATAAERASRKWGLP